MILSRTTRAVCAVTLAVIGLLTSASFMSTSDAATATPSPIESVSLKWAVSTNVNTAGSLTPSRAALSPATEDTSGWSFTQGTGSIDADTGVTHLTYEGGLEVGNVNRGNYGVQFTNLAIDMAPGGTGSLTASVAYRGPGSDVWNTPVDGVTLADFVAGAPTVSGRTVTWTVTPTPESVPTDPAFAGAKQFPQELLDVLPPAFHGHFMQTSNAGPDAQVNLDKLPAPLTFSYTTEAPAATTSTTSTTVPGSSTTVPGPTTSLPSSEEPVEATAGRLDWGIKSSFIGYLESPAAAGTITLTGGTTRDGAVFSFPLGEGSEYLSASNFSAPFAGTFRVTAHGGVLDIFFENPRVAISGTSGTLVADATSKNQDTGVVETFDNVVLATLDLTGVQATADGQDVTLADIPATLTEAGAPVFGGFYTAGQALDPVTIVLTVDTTEALPEATTPTVTCVDATVTAGETVRLCGEGFLPGEQVQAFVHSDPILLGVTTADAEGNVDAHFTVPITLTPGIHRFELRGVTSGLSLMSGQVQVVAAGADGTGTTTPDTTGMPGESLARTGTEARTLIGLGLVALAAGITITAATTRRREA